MSALRLRVLTNVSPLARAQTPRADPTRESTAERGRSLVYLPMLHTSTRQDTVSPEVWTERRTAAKQERVEFSGL